jgi:hypothetical protein
VAAEIKVDPRRLFVFDGAGLLVRAPDSFAARPMTVLV